MLGNYYYLFNVKAEPLPILMYVKPFSMVINRKEIVKNIVKGGKEEALCICSIWYA